MGLSDIIRKIYIATKCFRNINLTTGTKLGATKKGLLFGY